MEIGGKMKKTSLTEYYVIKTIDNYEYICTPTIIENSNTHGFKLINSKTPNGQTTINYSEVSEIISLCEYMKRLSEKLLELPEIYNDEQLNNFFHKMHELNEILETPNETIIKM